MTCIEDQSGQALTTHEDGSLQGLTYIPALSADSFYDPFNSYSTTLSPQNHAFPIYQLSYLSKAFTDREFETGLL